MGSGPKGTFRRRCPAAVADRPGNGSSRISCLGRGGSASIALVQLHLRGLLGSYCRCLQYPRESFLHLFRGLLLMA
jgi:hypothetical protein